MHQVKAQEIPNTFASIARLPGHEVGATHSRSYNGYGSGMLGIGCSNAAQKLCIVWGLHRPFQSISQIFNSAVPLTPRLVVRCCDIGDAIRILARSSLSPRFKLAEADT